MSPSARQALLKMTANTAAADTNGTAVALTEPSTGFVSFRWQQPSRPPTQNVISAAAPVLAADNSAEVLQIVQFMQ